MAGIKAQIKQDEIFRRMTAIQKEGGIIEMFELGIKLSKLNNRRKAGANEDCPKISDYINEFNLWLDRKSA